jgi:non-heme chloroperoxidase
LTRRAGFLSVLLLLLAFCATGKTQQSATAPSTATTQFITVEPGVKLEVLDWGGTGRPMILLTGLGRDAHIFDGFAPKLTANYHVYGITRRGFGKSDTPLPVGKNYSADRLGDDVLAVIDALKIVRPVLVGHSIAGEELSSIGSRYPERVAGLVYLDAGYPYAFYNSKVGDLLVDAVELRRLLDALVAAQIQTPQDQRSVATTLLAVNYNQFKGELADSLAALKDVPDQTPPTPAELPTRETASMNAILTGQQRYTHVDCPVLAIFAVPHDRGLAAGPARDKADAEDLKETAAQADAFAAGIPKAHVLRIAHARHQIFRSNEADVLREIDAFVASLK